MRFEQNDITGFGHHRVCRSSDVVLVEPHSLNPSAFVLGRPGSSLMRRMVAILAAWNDVLMVLSDTKPTMPI